MTNPLDSIMGSGSKSFPFDKIGDQVTGTILDVAERQQTDMKTNEPATWPNGQPKMMYTIKLQTELQEGPDDDGVRHVNLKWKSLRAFQDAVRDAGESKVKLGAKLSLKYIGDGIPTSRGAMPPKEWKAWYQAPEPSAGILDSPFDKASGSVGARPVATETPSWAKPQDEEPPF